MDYSRLLTLFRPEAKKWETKGDSYDDLVWNEETPKPTQEDFKNMQIEFEKIDYRFARERLYNERGLTNDNMTVAVWEKVIEGRPESADAMQIVRQEVKSEIPKPTQK